MKKIYICVWCVVWIVPLLTFGQRLPSVYYNKVRITLPDKIIRAEIAEENPHIKTDKHLVYYWYKANAIHTTQGGFDGKLLDGIYTEYYPNNNLKIKGVFKTGLKNDEWKSWNEDGKLIDMYTWKKGVRWGAFAVYNAQGDLQTSGNYKKDLLNGLITNYYSRDSIEVTKYRAGKVVLPNTDSISFWQKLNIFRHKKTISDTTHHPNSTASPKK